MKIRNKESTEATFNIQSNLIKNSIDEANFPQLLLTNKQFLGFLKLLRIIHQLIWNYQKLMYEIGQSGWYLSRLLWQLLKIGLPLMKNVLKPLAKSALKPKWKMYWKNLLKVF